jgi:hypothetical protein
MEKTESALTRRRMMLITGGAIAGAGALIAAPFREEIAATARQVLTSTPLGRGFVSLADAGYEEWGRQVGSVFTLGDGTRLTLAGVRARPRVRRLVRSGPGPERRRRPHPQCHPRRIWAAAALPVRDERCAHAPPHARRLQLELGTVYIFAGAVRVSARAMGKIMDCPHLTGAR